jgi:hypothetical protein
LRLPHRFRHYVPMPAQIGTLNENPLHAALKEWYTEPGDLTEVPVDGFVVDIVRGGLLVEIQTANFSAIGRKLAGLAACHRVRLVYPIAVEKWIVRLDRAGAVLGRRRSPKRGAVEHLFEELVRIPRLPADPNFSLDVLLTREEELRRHEVDRTGRSRRAWRRKGWVICERRLIEVAGRRLFRTPADLAALLPEGLPEPFTTVEIAEAGGHPRWLAQKMAYCLRHMGAILQEGKRGNALLYRRAA